MEMVAHFLPSHTTTTLILAALQQVLDIILITECLLIFNVNQSFDVLTIGKYVIGSIAAIPFAFKLLLARFATHTFKQALSNRILEVSEVFRCQIASAHFFLCVS